MVRRWRAVVPPPHAVFDGPGAVVTDCTAGAHGSRGFNIVAAFREPGEFGVLFAEGVLVPDASAPVEDVVEVELAEIQHAFSDT